jgi:hypothetical protein
MSFSIMTVYICTADFTHTIVMSVSEFLKTWTCGGGEYNNLLPVLVCRCILIYLLLLPDLSVKQSWFLFDFSGFEFVCRGYAFDFAVTIN